MSKLVHRILAALIIICLVNFFTGEEVFAATKASRFVTIQSSDGDDTGSLSQPRVKLRRKDVERTFVSSTNVAVVPLQVDLNGLVGPENATTRTYVNAMGYEPVPQIDGSIKEEFRFKVTFPIPIRKADKGKNGPVAKRVTFRIPIPYDQQEEAMNLYLIGERGEKFKFELPAMAAKRVIEDSVPMISELELPPTVADMTTEESTLFRKFRDSLWRDPNLMLRTSKTPGVSINPRNPDGVFFDIPNKKRLIKSLKKGKLVVNTGEGSTIIQGTSILGVGTPLDRDIYRTTAEGNGFITVVSRGGSPDNFDDPLITSLSSSSLTGTSALSAAIFAQGQDTDVYFSRKLEADGSWEHVLMSQGGASGPAGPAGPAGDPGTSVLPACQDTVDNDGDGLIDFPLDTGCSSATDNDEFNPLPECSDSADNDGDGLIDFPADNGCTSANDNSEFEPPNPACSDGIDNDGDGLIDTADPGCTGPSDNNEFNVVNQCQDGIDNDADGLVDFPADTGCANANDNEFKQCQDGADNDGNGAIDLVDPGCSGPTDPSESSPQCSDLLDNDGDTLVDLLDPGCSGPTDNNESNTTLTTEIVNIPATGANTPATLALAPMIAAVNVTRVVINDNTVPFQNLTIFFNGTGDITGFQYTGSPVFAAGNASSAAPNFTNMGLAFYKDTGSDVIVFRGLDLGLGFYIHVLNLSYLP